jgi:hypothetical protein
VSLISTFSAVFQLLRLPAGRVGWALVQTADRADALGDAALAARARAGVEAATAQRAVEARWRDQRDGRAGTVDPELGRLDLQIDAGLHDLQDLLQIFSRSGIPARAEPARRLLAAAFRRPLVEHTQLPWSEQVSMNEDLLTVLRDPVHADDLRKLDLGPTVDRLEALQIEFRARLPARTAEPLSWEEVLAGRAALHVAYLGIVAEIIGRYGQPGQERALQSLLAPALAQEAEIRAWRRGRRNGEVADVSPETGEPSAPEVSESGA